MESGGWLGAGRRGFLEYAMADDEYVEKLLMDGVRLPSATFEVSRPLRVDGRDVIGSGTILRWPNGMAGDYCLAVVRRPNALIHGITMECGGDGKCLGPGTHAGVPHGLVVRESPGVMVSRCVIRRACAQGINIDGCERVTVMDTEASECGRDGIAILRSVRDVRVIGCNVWQVGDDGIAIWSGYSQHTPPCVRNVMVYGCRIVQRMAHDANAMGCGIRFGSVVEGSIASCEVSRTVKAGVALWRSSQSSDYCSRILVANTTMIAIGSQQSQHWPNQSREQIDLSGCASGGVRIV